MHHQKEPVILIVEDEPDLADLIRRSLQFLSNTYTIISVSIPQEAIVLFPKYTFALIITDYRLGTISGIQFTRTIKRIAPETPVILLTGEDITTISQKAKAAGVTMLIQKPFSLSELYQAVRQLLPSTN